MMCFIISHINIHINTIKEEYKVCLPKCFAIERKCLKLLQVLIDYSYMLIFYCISKVLQTLILKLTTSQPFYQTMS